MIFSRDNRLDPHSLSVDESVMATQNNYLGVRGNFEEGTPYQKSIRGTYINGFYDSHIIPYGESSYGFPEKGQSIVNLPDAQSIIVKINGNPLDLNYAKLITLKRRYHLKKGYTLRSALYETMEGYQFWIHATRITHLSMKPLFMIDYTIESLNYEGEIIIESTLNGAVENYLSTTDMRAGSIKPTRLTEPSIHIHSDCAEMSIKTISTGFECKIGLTHSVPFKYEAQEKQIIATKATELSQNESFNFQKFALYYNELDHPEMDVLIESGYRFVKNTPVSDIYGMQAEYLDGMQSFFQINIQSDIDTDFNSMIHYNIYQLFTSGAHSPRTNIPAKGLTGEGYEGHTFWDSEIYMLPFFMQIDQKLAKNMLEYRYYQIESARKEAQKLGVPEGIKFAWRTISGEETSAYYPASTAQYHINSDIAYAVIEYYKLYRDETFMAHKGFLILLETARFFKDLVTKYDGVYHIHHVTGPDEYNAVVDDNYYTNAMLKYHIEFLLDYTKTRDDLINDEERAFFQDIVNNLYLPFSKSLNVDLQDASFLMKKPVLVEELDPKKRPLLLHYHPLTIYRHQVIKQADTVLAHMLLKNRPLDILKDSFEFYEKRTTHDSSLSFCVHSTQAAIIGDRKKARDYFVQAVDLDVNDTHKNTFDGLHMANMGGVYLSLLRGFLGYSIEEPITIKPILPEEWESLAMNIRINRDTTALVKVMHGNIEITANQDSTIRVYDTTYELKKDKPVKIESNE